MAFRTNKPKRDVLFIPVAVLANSPDPFYTKINEVLSQAGSDRFAEKLRAPGSATDPG